MEEHVEVCGVSLNNFKVARISHFQKYRGARFISQGDYLYTRSFPLGTLSTPSSHLPGGRERRSGDTVRHTQDRPGVR